MSDPIRVTPLKDFIKDHTGLRLGTPAATHLVELLNQLVVHIADHAKAAADQEDRRTILQRDLQAGLEDFINTKGPSLAQPDAVLAAINQIDNPGLTRLVQLLGQEINRDQ